MNVPSGARSAWSHAVIAVVTTAALLLQQIVVPLHLASHDHLPLHAHAAGGELVAADHVAQHGDHAHPHAHPHAHAPAAEHAEDPEHPPHPAADHLDGLLAPQPTGPAPLAPHLAAPDVASLGVAAAPDVAVPRIDGFGSLPRPPPPTDAVGPRAPPLVA